MEQAYVLIWRHGILMDIHDDGLEGKTLKIYKKKTFPNPDPFKSKSTTFNLIQDFKEKAYLNEA